MTQLWVSLVVKLVTTRVAYLINKPLHIFIHSTIIYELISLEHPYKHLPAECLIWQVGQGRTQSVTLLPKGRFRNIIHSCWRGNPHRRPSFTELLVILEETVSCDLALSS